MHPESRRAAVRELIDQAEEAGLAGLPDAEICLLVLRALANDGPDGGLRALCGGPASLAALCDMMTGGRLKSFIEQLQAWTTDWTVSLYEDADGNLPAADAWRIANARALIDSLVEDGAISVGLTPFGEPFFTLSGDVQGMCLRDMASAARKAQVLQYRRPGEERDRLGRALAGDRDGLIMRCEASGERQWVAYRSIRFDGAHAAHDMLDAIRLAQRPGVPMSLIPVAGFDPAGEPELRMFADGAIELVLRKAPPSWATQGVRFDAFASALSEAAELPVTAVGDGVFRLARSQPQTMPALLEFLQGHLAVPRERKPGAAPSSPGLGAMHPEWAVLMAAAQAAQGTAGEPALIGLLQTFNRVGRNVLRECFGDPIDPLALSRWLPPQLLEELAQVCQSWHDGVAPAQRWKQPHYRSTRRLMEILIEDGIVRLRPEMAGARLQFRVEFPLMRGEAA